jgi:16S rRNA (guanine527-N7)-methyltransferase
MIQRRHRASSAPDLKADRAAALALTPVSRETSDRLDRYVQLLLQWQPVINLVAPSTLPVLWTRHIADSLQLLPLVPGARTWVDLGSGAGLPGLALAAALAEVPGAAVHLVESNRKKVAFLREAARHMAVPATVHAVRIEEFVQNFTGRVDAVTARALAPLDRLLKLAHPLMQRGAQGVFLKGQDVEAELTTATRYWAIEAEILPSVTSPGGRIVLIRTAIPRAKER